jgi:probable HAF family extracellular repeat protein
MNAKHVGLGFLCGVLLCTVPCYGAARYRLTDLGEGNVTTIAHDSNVVVGTRTVNKQQVAFQLYPTDINLGFLPGGNFSQANGTRGGRHVGYASTGLYGSYTHAFAYDGSTGVMQDLGTTGDSTLFSAATDLNATDIVGYADSADGTTTVPVVWVDGTTILVLPTLGGGRGSVDAVNDLGDAVGTSRTTAGATHCTVWKATGELLDCHSIGTFSLGLGINNAGQVVGYTLTAEGQRGFVWLPFTGAMLLPPVPGDTHASAYAINEDGDIVGRSYLPAPCACTPTHEAAVLWQNGQPVDLLPQVNNGQGWVLSVALGINDAGVIVGQGTFEGTLHAFMLTPVQDAHAQKKPPKVKKQMARN